MNGRTLRAIGGWAGTGLLSFVVVAGLLGSQDGSRNPANYLVWLYFWPGVPIAVALVGDFWRQINPWRFLPALGLRVDASRGAPVKVWPAVVAFTSFAWFDLASGYSGRPQYLAVGLIVFTAVLLVPLAFGYGQWLIRAEPFGLVMAAIGRCSLPSLVGLGRAKDDPPAGWDRFALYTLPLSAALFDATLAMPQWLSLVTALAGGAGLERGGLAFAAVRTAALALAALAVAGLVLLAAAIAGPAVQLRANATRLALVTLPAAVALMAAHNLPALLHLGPRLPRVLGAFLTGEAATDGLSAEAPLGVTSTSVLWAAQVALLLLGFLWSGWLAWRKLGHPGASPLDRLAAAYPALVMLVITSACALIIVYLGSM